MLNTIDFKPKLKELFPLAQHDKIAVLPTCEYEGIFRNGGIGTYYKNLALKLESQGWYIILILLNDRNQRFSGESNFTEIKNIFSMQEIENVLNLQEIHLSLLENIKDDWLNHLSFCCLFFVQAIVKQFENSKIYVEFHETTGLGYQTIQAKQAGLFGNNCVIATTMHSGHEWVYEANEKYVYEDTDYFLKLSCLEQYSFETSDLTFFPSHYLRSKVESYGWRNSKALHMPYFIPLISKSRATFPTNHMPYLTPSIPTSSKVLNSQRFRLEDQDNELKDIIKSILLETYFKGAKETGLIPEEALDRDLKEHIYRRYNQVIDFTIPWVDRYYCLSGKTLIEVGCGTGSSTAAFAHFVDKVYAYDIQGVSIEVAKQRLDAMSLHNVIFYPCSPESILSSIRENHPEGANCVLLFAVLEHMTIAERIETLKTVWELLQPGGIIIISETPNRLSYWDWHTSWMSFLHLLPEELYLQYYRKSPRMEYVSVVDEARRESEDKAKDVMVRWGAFGVSYHEFEVALGENIHDYIIANGFENEILSQYPMKLEDRLLEQYFLERLPNKNIGFSRAYLSLILKKEY